MDAHSLNQSGAKVDEKGFDIGNRVYFYKPPTQQEIVRRGRKAKHLAHYHDLAVMQSKVDGCEPGKKSLSYARPKRPTKRGTLRKCTRSTPKKSR
jgi:hypothetical protein